MLVTRRRKRFVGATLMAVIGAVLGTFASLAAVDRRLTGDPVTPPPGLPVLETLLDLRPVSVTMLVAWEKVRTSTTVERLTSDPLLWRNMHFGDWDPLPQEYRSAALARMRARYAPAVNGPAVWSGMGAHHWDQVPPPIRMVVFPLMAEYWTAVYGVGQEFDLHPQLVADTVSAILMAESWFDHRAFFENEWGNRDMGLGQCSDRCRRELAEMAGEGLLDFEFADEDYYNPWHATRAAAVWFGLELQRAEGDLELAIRAYHRGFRAASRGEGADYLTNVERLRSAYISGEIASPTWRALRWWARAIAAERAAVRL